LRSAIARGSDKGKAGRADGRGGTRTVERGVITRQDFFDREMLKPQLRG